MSEPSQKTKEILPKIIKLKAEGKSCREIAKLTGGSPSNVAYLYRTHAKDYEVIKTESRSVKEKRELKEKAKALYAEGKTLREVGKLLGVHGSTIGLWIKGKPIQKETPPEPSKPVLPAIRQVDLSELRGIEPLPPEPEDERIKVFVFEGQSRTLAPILARLFD